MNTITLSESTFGAMYDALNIAYERLVMNNLEHTEGPWIAVINDAIARAEEEI